MKRKLLIGGLVAISAVVGATPAFAVHEPEFESGTSRTGSSKDLRQRVESRVDDTSRTVKQTVDNSVPLLDGSEELRAERIEQRRLELEKRLEERNQKRQSRLDGRRLAQCQNRQTNINALMGRSAENGQRHLDNINRVKSKVLDFAEKKSLAKDTYATELAAVEEKEAEVTGVVQAVTAQSFDCNQLDGSNPAAALRMMNEEKRAALNAYRQSVIDLIQAVKASFASLQNDSENQSDGSADSGNTDGMQEGAQ